MLTFDFWSIIRNESRKSLVMSFAALFCMLAQGLAFIPQAYAFGSNPTPYDPEGFVPSTLVPRSTSSYFVLDASLPLEYQRALDDRKFIGITGLYHGGLTNRISNESASISVNDTSLMNDPRTVCSVYAMDVCYNVEKFYKPKSPQLGIVGLFALDGSTMLQWGVNTGYNSRKLTVSPSVMLGLAKRFYFSDERRDSHIIFEASQWFGGHVTHRPCIDGFNREYFCGDLSAWSGYAYDPTPMSLYYKITFETLF